MSHDRFLIYFFCRFMWFCFTVTGGVSALIIIVSLWEKFQTNPTITGNIYENLTYPPVVSVYKLR